MSSVADWIPLLFLIVATIGPSVFFRSPTRRRLAAFLPCFALLGLALLIGAMGWGYAGDRPDEGLSSGSDAVGWLFAAVLAYPLGLIGLTVAGIVRVLRRRSANRPAVS